MPEITVEVDESTALLHGTLEADGDIPEDVLNAVLADTLGQGVREAYNNRESIKEQVAEMPGEGEADESEQE